MSYYSVKYYTYNESSGENKIFSEKKVPDFMPARLAVRRAFGELREEWKFSKTPLDRALATHPDGKIITVTRED